MLSVLLFITKLGIIIGVVLLNVSNTAGLLSPESAWREPGAYKGIFVAGALLLVLSFAVGLAFFA